MMYFSVFGIEDLQVLLIMKKVVIICKNKQKNITHTEKNLN